MKTTIVSQGAEPVAAETFPALYTSLNCPDAVYLFNDSQIGHCLVTGGSGYAVGQKCNCPASSYDRIKTPVTITFTP